MYSKRQDPVYCAHRIRILKGMATVHEAKSIKLRLRAYRLNSNALIEQAADIDHEALRLLHIADELEKRLTRRSAPRRRS